MLKCLKVLDKNVTLISAFVITTKQRVTGLESYTNTVDYLTLRESYSKSLTNFGEFWLENLQRLAKRGKIKYVKNF